jgi:aminoglycoside phosphotransferase (APT) family kinase protein
MIDVSLARRLIESQFPQWSHLPIAAVELDGWDNRTFRLGSELTVRLPSGSWYAQQVDKEQRWLPVLAPRLPLSIPMPVAKGEPDFGFPYPWSVYRWLDGEVASKARISDLPGFATTLAGFLNALRRVDATGGPAPGEHNFFRGGPLGTYEDEAFQAIDALGDEVPAEAVKRVWDDAMSTSWDREPVWLHGDVAAGNLLVRDGRLAAVLDFGSSGVGDPACDMVIAWTFLFGPSRARFRAQLEADAGTWSRGRGWGLWKALITLVGHLERDAPNAAVPRRDIDQILTDYAQDH